MHAGLGVHHREEQVGLVDRLEDLLADLRVHGAPRVLGQSAGVDEPERPAGPVGAREVAVPRRPRLVGDDRRVVSDNAVEERRLADVRTADDGDHRQSHAAAAPDATLPAPSGASASMKSYDG